MLLAALTSTACRTMKPVSLEQLNVLKPDRVWVTDADRPVVVVSGPHVVGDTLVGFVNGNYEQLPNAGLKRVTAQTLAPTRTALLAVGLATALGAAVLLKIADDRVPQSLAIPPGDCDKHPTDPACS
jgi:hypothetical protein